MSPYCHTELVQSGQKYDLGWELIPINNSWGEKRQICNNLLLYESDVMQGGGYAVSISLVVQSMVAQVWRPGHV